MYMPEPGTRAEDLPEVLKPAEAAALLRVARSSLVRLKEIPFFYLHPKTKRGRRYSKTALLAYINTPHKDEPKPCPSRKRRVAASSTTTSKLPVRGIEAAQAAYPAAKPKSLSSRNAKKLAPPSPPVALIRSE